MTSAILYTEWVGVIRTEYLNTFIKDGGSAIKFAVPMDDFARPKLMACLKDVAAELGYLTAEVDAGQTRVHMMQEVFFRIADQIDWRRLARDVVSTLAEESGYPVPDSGDGPLLDRIAEIHGVDQMLVRAELNRRLNDRVFRNRGLAKDFRVAVVQLCMAELSGGPDGANDTAVLTDWLTGRNRRISAVKPYMIYSSINRTNARYMFESLLNWVRFAGRSGLLVLLDTSRVTLRRNPRDGSVYYSGPAVKDFYEVLRQFIDGIDRLPGCLIVVSPDVEFLSEDARDRGYGAYQALMFRVVDEVRDRELVNPMSSLARIRGAARGGDS